MKSALTGAVIGLGILLPATAHAAPGMANEVYGATVQAGTTELETRYDGLAGGPDDGEDVIKLEAAHGVTKRLRLGVLGEFEREAGGTRRAEELGVEAIYALGQVGGVDVAVYGEYAIGLHGPDKAETKLLLERRQGPLDLRLNLIAEKALKTHENVELSYAAQADVAVLDDLRLGVQAFGDLGTVNHFAPHAEHFIGPAAHFDIEGLGPELEVETGYLFALGKARADTKGQFRIAVGMEF